MRARFLGWPIRRGDRIQAICWNALAYYRCVFHTLPLKVYVPAAMPHAVLELRGMGLIVEEDESCADELRLVFKPDASGTRYARCASHYNLEQHGDGYYRVVRP